MEEQAPSNFMKERWAASYDPARKVTYVSWFLGTVAYFLDKLDFSTLVSPPVETEFPVFIAEPPSAPLDPAPPPCSQAPAASSSARRRGSRPTHRSGRTRRQTGPPVPALERRRARRPSGARGAERRRPPRPTAPRNPGSGRRTNGATSEDVIHLRSRPRSNSSGLGHSEEDVIQLHLGDNQPVGPAASTTRPRDRSRLNLPPYCQAFERISPSFP